MRTTLDLTDEAYHIARTVAREQKSSLGRVVSEFIVRTTTTSTTQGKAETGEGLPTFRCKRRITSDDVRALDDEE